jgi:hypothetical protein
MNLAQSISVIVINAILDMSSIIVTVMTAEEEEVPPVLSDPLVQRVIRERKVPPDPLVLKVM